MMAFTDTLNSGLLGKSLNRTMERILETSKIMPTKFSRALLTSPTSHGKLCGASFTYKHKGVKL